MHSQSPPGLTATPQGLAAPSVVSSSRTVLNALRCSVSMIVTALVWTQPRSICDVGNL